MNTFSTTQQTPDGGTLRLIVGQCWPQSPKAEDRMRRLLEQRYACILEADFARRRAHRAERRAYCLLWAAAIGWSALVVGIVAWCFGE